MFNKRSIATFVLIFALGISVNAKDLLSATNYIKITLLSITLGTNSNDTMIETSLQYDGPEKCIKISAFDLQFGVIKTGMFFSSNGVAWSFIEPSGVERMPAQPSMDYIIELHQGSNTAFKITYDKLERLLPLNFARNSTIPRFNGKYPTMLNYQLAAKVSAVVCNSNSPPQWFVTGGKGNVKLLLNDR